MGNVVICNVKLPKGYDYRKVLAALEECGIHMHPSLGPDASHYVWYDVYVNRNMYNIIPMGYDEEVATSVDFGDDIEQFLNYVKHDTK